MPPRALPTDPAKLLPPILRHLESSPPDAYSAHQKARTTAARLVHSGHDDAAVEVLYGASKELMKVKEWGSGCDLAVYMVQVYQGSEVVVTDESRARITQLLALLSGEGAWRKRLADIAIKWSSDCGDCPTGDPDLHQYLGELYYKDRAYPLALPHLVSACKRDAAVLLAEMMYDWTEQGRRDPGPYACVAALPFLSIVPPAVGPAQAFLSTFITRLASSPHLPDFVSTTLPAPDSDTDRQIRLTPSPALNFLQLATAAVQRAPKEGTSGVQARGTTGGVGREWDTLVRRYRAAGGALGEQAVQEALMHISTAVFLNQPPRGAGGGGADMLQNLMGSLFGGGGGAPGGGAPRIR